MLFRSAKVSDEDYQKVLDAFNNPQPYPDEFFEEAERREKERKALDAEEMLDAARTANKAVEVALEKQKWEREVRKERILIRYNEYHNTETSGLPHGMPITPEHQQIIAFESMIDALRCEHLNDEFNVILISDIEDLIERLRNQANEFLERVRTVQKPSQESTKTDLDAL